MSIVPDRECAMTEEHAEIFSCSYAKNPFFCLLYTAILLPQFYTSGKKAQTFPANNQFLLFELVKTNLLRKI